MEEEEREEGLATGRTRRRRRDERLRWWGPKNGNEVSTRSH